MSDQDEADERRVADKVMELLSQEGMTLGVVIQKVPMQVPDGSFVWADKAAVEIKKKRSQLVLPSDAATKKVALELLSGGGRG